MYAKERVSDQEPMRTTININDALMRKAMRLSGLTTKKAVVEAALAYSFKRIFRPHPAASRQGQMGRESRRLPSRTRLSHPERSRSFTK